MDPGAESSVARFTYCPACAAAAGPVTRVNEFRCAACGFRFFQNNAAAVMAICADGRGRVLFLVRGRDPGRGLLGMPGGFVDPGETLEEALERELREEIGLVGASYRYLVSFPNTYLFAGVTYRTCDTVFACTGDFSALKADPGEVADMEWLDPACVDPGRIAFESVRRALAAYCRRVGAPHAR